MSVGVRISGSWLGLLLSSLLVGPACSRAPAPATVPPEPEPEPEVEAGNETPFEENTYVSTDYNEDEDEDEAEAEAEPENGEEAPEHKAYEGFAVTTPDQIKEVAEEAVSEQLDPDRTWELSPVLPAAWPSTEPLAAVLFYPLAPNPPSLTEFQVYTPAFRVTVSLTDASTTIEPVGKRRKLGTIKKKRATSLERRELDMAEVSLVKQMLGDEVEMSRRPFWGYLKFIHEHPKIGKDMERRASKFIGYIRRKHGK